MDAHQIVGLIAVVLAFVPLTGLAVFFYRSRVR